MNWLRNLSPFSQFLLGYMMAFVGGVITGHSADLPNGKYRSEKVLVGFVIVAVGGALLLVAMERVSKGVR